MMQKPTDPHPADLVGSVARSAIETDFLITNRLIPSFEFARLIGVRPTTEESMRSRGETPPFHKAGAQILYAYDDVMAWIESRRTTKARKVTLTQAIEADLLGTRK